jgi:hypothetical protein
MLPYSALQAANYQNAIAACLPQQLAQMQAAAVAQHYTSLSASQVNMSPSIVNSLAGQHQHPGHGVQVTAMNSYTHPSGAVYATATGLTQAQAQALQAMGHHQHHQQQMVSSVASMALSPSMGSVTLSHPNMSMQKLLSLPPPKVGPVFPFFINL